MFHTLAVKLDLKEREQLSLINDIATNMFDDQVSKTIGNLTIVSQFIKFKTFTLVML